MHPFRPLQTAAVGLLLTTLLGTAARGDVLPPVSERFAQGDIQETPSFQKHVVPLFGRLGCNGRACHGSFQGQGGLRLSLFGYDFKADHEALLDKDSPRIDLEEPLESLILVKPTDEDMHEGGLRYEKGSWQHHLLRRWVEQKAPYSGSETQKIDTLRVTPSELIFGKSGQKVQLKAVAVWENGTEEDVTCLCRFQSNDEQIAKIDEDGLVISGDRGDTHVVISYDNAVVPIPVIRPVSELAGDKYPDVPTPTLVDELVAAKLRKLGIVPSELSSDVEFLRRVTLDMTGTLPTPEDVESFLGDNRKDKRARKIDDLLETPAYAAWWTTRLCDYTGNNSAALVNVTPVRGRETQDWFDWIYERVADNAPYDEIAAGIVLATSREGSESYTEFCQEMSAIYSGKSERTFADREFMPYFWARRNLRQPEEKAIGFAYAFMGIRIQCAQCHKHPFDQWSKQDFDDFKNLFTRVTFANGAASDSRNEYTKLVNSLGLKGKRGNELRREVPKLIKQGKTVPFSEVYATQPQPANKAKGRGSKPAPQRGPTAKILGGETLALNDYSDPREPLMDWLRSKDNPYFAKAFVNRVWANYFNVGIVEPPDDLSLANPPSNKQLLDHLAQGFIDHDFDMKWLHREITNSRTYQLSWMTNETNALDEKNFSRSVPRRMPAEVVYDAIQQATASKERLESLQKDLKDRAVAIAGASPRTANRGPQYALTVFGRSIRESNCDCDRSAEASLLQTVYLQNDSDLLTMLDRTRDGWLDELRRGWKDSMGARDGDIQPLRGKLKRLESQRESLKQRTLRAPKKQVPAVRKQLVRLTQQLEALREELAKLEEEAAQTLEIETPELVRQAYLRSLSRLPTDQEQAVAQQYIAAAGDPADGLRDVLWALLNTKEFIVNH